MIGFDSGSTICEKNRRSLAPSRREHSSSSCGMVVWKKVRVTISCHTLTAPGRIIAQIVLSIPRSRTTR